MNVGKAHFCLSHRLNVCPSSSVAEISQETMPSELPVRGDPFTEVQLELSFPKGRPLFILNGRKLQLLQPLDRDKDNLSHIVFQVKFKFFYTFVTPSDSVFRPALTIFGHPMVYIDE